MWPGCTTSKVPWHMMTLRLRGRGPMAATSSSIVLILCLYFASITALFLQRSGDSISNQVLVALAIESGSHSGASRQ